MALTDDSWDRKESGTLTLSVCGLIEMFDRRSPGGRSTVQQTNTSNVVEVYLSCNTAVKATPLTPASSASWTLFQEYLGRFGFFNLFR